MVANSSVSTFFCRWRRSLALALCSRACCFCNTFLILLFLIPEPLSANDTSLIRDESKPLRLVTGEFPPFVGQNLPHGGRTARLLHELFADFDRDIRVDFLPWKRGYAETLKGRYFATFPYSYNAEREQNWHFSKPLYVLNEVFFVRRGSDISFDSNKDLEGRSICKPIGYNLFELTQLLEDKLVRLEQPVSMPACFRMLAVGRVDMVLTNKVTGRQIMKDLDFEFERFTVLPKPFKTISHHLIIPRSAPDGLANIERFNKVLDEWKQKQVATDILFQTQ